MDCQQDLPLAIKIGASTFHPTHNQAKLNALLAELSPYQTTEDILETFRSCLPNDRSCAAEAVLWACRCAVVIADRDRLLNFIDQLAHEIDAIYEGVRP